MSLLNEFEWKQRVRVVRLTQNSARSLRPADTLQNGATLKRIEELLNKVIVFVFVFFA